MWPVISSLIACVIQSACCGWKDVSFSLVRERHGVFSGGRATNKDISLLLPASALRLVLIRVKIDLGRPSLGGYVIFLNAGIHMILFHSAGW
jgi:hypothetical protein